MAETQKKMFAVKTSRRFSGLEYPASVNVATLDAFLAPSKIVREIQVLDARAKIAGLNTCAEVGIYPHNFVRLCVWINARHENNGLAADHWAHTPRIEAATRAVNTTFNINMTPWHYNELQIDMRKFKKGALSTYDYARSKKKTDA